ncbi:hypothetical protein B566_EDAN007298 [Ephemera danica]|nr:hypothetical protein B566_EDAN007298 [Ephemera danica]
MRQFFAIVGILLIILAYMQQQTDDVTAKLHLGLICCTVTIIFFAAPLTMLAHVIRVKSAESLPFSLIVANLIVSAEWLLYGIVIEDPFVVVALQSTKCSFVVTARLLTVGKSFVTASRLARQKKGEVGDLLERRVERWSFFSSIHRTHTVVPFNSSDSKGDRDDTSRLSKGRKFMLCS